MTSFTWVTGLHVVIDIVGLAICVWAYRQCRKPGYLVIGVYFVSAVCNLLVLPFINNTLEKSWPAPPPVQAREANRPDTISSPPVSVPVVLPPRRRTVRVYSLGSVLLVAGLWLVARCERRQDPASSPGSSAVPPHRDI